MTGLQSGGDDRQLVLASASRSRAAMLTNAGLSFAIDASGIDEQAIKVGYSHERTPVDRVAAHLAQEKACDVSRRNPGALVLGADQMLECEGDWFDKPKDMVGALKQLQRLRGRTHHLVTAAVVVRDGVIVWDRVERAEMVMREASDMFLQLYLDEVGEDACRSVGAYQLEGRGAQLFDRVSGDFFVVLGLPLLPLLEFLRGEGVLQR